MVSCVVVGQSNSVLREGFASILAGGELSHKITGFKRGAIGSSSAILAPFFIQPGFCKGFDYCIIDLVMFEYHVSATSKGAYTGYEISRILEYLIHTVRRDGCQPILMIFSPQWANLKHGWIGDLHKRVAQTNSCFYFDFCTFMADVLHADVADLGQFYSDVNHPNSVVQKAIAECLAAFMHADIAIPSCAEIVEAFMPQFDVIRFKDVPDGTPVQARKNSLIEETFIKVQGDHTHRVDIGGDGWVRGIAINATASFGKIALRGEREVVKDLSSREFDEDRFVMQFVPIYADLKEKGGSISIGLTDASETESHFVGQSVATLGKHQIELSALIVERPVRVPVSYAVKWPDPGRLDIIRSR